MAKMTVTGNWDDCNCIGFSLSDTFFSRNLWFTCDECIDYYRTNVCDI